MNPAVLTQIAHVDPNAAPVNINELIDILNPGLQSAISGQYIPYIILNQTPGVEDQDKAWIELDSNNRPLSIKTFYQGKWRRVYNGMLGEIRIFSGDPTINTNWHSDGRGVEGGIYDGWQICNGNNGSVDLTNQFVIPANLDASGFGYNSSTGKWETKVDGSTLVNTGGNAKGQVTLQSVPGAAGPDQIPRTARPDLIVKFMHSVSGDAGGGDLYGPITPNGEFQTTLLAGDPGNPSSSHPKVDPVNILPPFIAMGFIQFIGYQ